MFLSIQRHLQTKSINKTQGPNQLKLIKPIEQLPLSTTNDKKKIKDSCNIMSQTLPKKKPLIKGHINKLKNIQKDPDQTNEQYV